MLSVDYETSLLIIFIELMHRKLWPLAYCMGLRLVLETLVIASDTAQWSETLF